VDLAAATLLDLPSGMSAWRNIPDVREAFDNGPFSPERGQSPTAVLTTRCQTIVSPTLTYFLMGALAAHSLNYAAEMARPESGMRQITDPGVMAGPLFQPLRGFVFALVFYPLRQCFLAEKNDGCS
jgi:hypothetical protein